MDSGLEEVYYPLSIRISKMINLRENLLNIFKGIKPEFTPWFADLSWWYTGASKSNTLDDRYKGDGILQLYKDLDCGIYLPLINVYKEEVGCKVEIHQTDELLIRTFKTPYGDLREVIRDLKESFTISYEERLLKSASDIRALKYFYDSINYSRDYAEPARLDSMFKDQGIIIACLPRTPLSRLVVESAGIEAVTYAAFESPSEFNELIKVMQKKDDEAYKIVADGPAQFAMFPDNLSSEMISPRLFSEFSLEYYQKRNHELHRKNKITMVHIDGTLRGLLPILAKSGVDCVEGLTPFPVGDAHPNELRKLTGDGMILWGGIPSPLFTNNWRIDAFEVYVISYLEAMRENFRFVVGVGDQVPPGADLGRVKLAAEIITSFNK